jgi:hypothetical protein
MLQTRNVCGPFAGRLLEDTGGLCHAAYEARFEAKTWQEIRTGTGCRRGVLGAGGGRSRGNRWPDDGYGVPR